MTDHSLPRPHGDPVRTASRPWSGQWPTGWAKTKLQIWGSGVRIPSGAPARFSISPSARRTRPSVGSTVQSGNSPGTDDAEPVHSVGMGGRPGRVIGQVGRWGVTLLQGPAKCAG